MNDNAYINSDSSSGEAIQDWIPTVHCKQVGDLEVRMSKGFLRSLPARWFPGLSAHWLPLFHSTGVDFKVLEVLPMISPSDRKAQENQKPDELEPFGAWVIDDESVAIYADSHSRNMLLQAFIPNSSRHARKIMLDYLARRVAISLRASWSGMTNSQLKYESEFKFSSFKPQAWIRIKTVINGERASFSFGIARGLAEKLDGLWRRQIRPAGTGQLLNRHYNTASSSVRIELMRLSVSPSSLPSYLKSGSLIDLEIPLSPNVVLKIGEESWISAALCCCDGNFALETVSINPSSLRVVDGSTPLCVELGTITLDSATCVEIEQLGAILATDIPLGDLVQLTIRGERVGRAKLVCFEGRFALSIL